MKEIIFIFFALFTSSAVNGQEKIIAKFSGNTFECTYSNRSYNIGVKIIGDKRDTIIKFSSSNSIILAIAEKNDEVAVITAEDYGQYIYYSCYKKEENGKRPWILSELYHFPYRGSHKYFNLDFLDINMVEARSPKESQTREGAAKDTIFIIHDDGTTEVFLKEKEFKTAVLSNAELKQIMKKLEENQRKSIDEQNQKKN